MTTTAIGDTDRAPKPLLKPLWAVLVLFASWCAACAAVTITPEARSRIEADKRVAVVAPRVDIVRYFADGHGEAVQGEEARVAAKLGEAVAMELSRRRFAVKFAPLNRATASQIGDIYERIEYLYGMRQIPAEFDRFDPAYLEELGGERTIDISAPQADYCAGFAPGSVRIAAKSDADALVFVRFAKFERSAGSIAREAAIDFAVDMIRAPITILGGALVPAPYYGGTLAITLLDGKTGDVLWGTQVPYSGNLPLGESWTLSDMVAGSFGTFPQADKQ